MIKSEIWHEIHSRFKLKETKKAIARTLGVKHLDGLEGSAPSYASALPEGEAGKRVEAVPVVRTKPPQLHAASRPPVVVAAAQLTLCT